MSSVLRRSSLEILRAALVVALLSAFALTLAYQVRSRVKIDIGGKYDTPYVWRFLDAEGDDTQTYRWTRGKSRVELDAQNISTPWTLHLRMNGYRPDRPARVGVEMNGAALDSFEVSGGWDIYEVQGDIPAEAWSGNNTLVLLSDTFVPQKEIKGSTDSRTLGVVLDWLELTPARSSSVLGNEDYWLDFGRGPQLPPWGTVASWAFACALLYATARGIGLPARPVNLVFAGVIVVPALAFAFARPWIGYYTAQFLTLAVALAVLALVLVLLLPRLAAHFGQTLNPRALALLLAIVLLSVGLKWGGAWYPQFRSSDLMFHAHRLEFVATGKLFFTSELPDAARRVVPYPPAMYAALTPLTVFTHEYASPLVVLNALMDVIAILAIFFAAQKLARAETRNSNFALLAAFLFAFNPVVFWIYSWGNHTNIFAQDAATLLFALLLSQSVAYPRNFLFALFFLGLASMGHLGVFLSLLVLLPLAIVLRFLSRAQDARREAFALVLLLGVGLGLSYLVYYAEFSDALVKQAEKYFQDFGAGRAAVSGGITWARIGDVGRYTRDQLGWILLFVGLGGIPLALKNFEARGRVVWSAWLLVGIAFALVTIGSTFSTRYTFWAAPALALSGAFVLLWLLEKSRAAQFVAYALCAFAFLQTMWVWFDRVWNAYH